MPLAGFALQAEERRSLVRAAREFGSNPVAVAGHAYDTAGLYLRAGNFRPLGRFAEKAEHALAFEAAEATGLSLHSVQGALRLVMVAAVAMAATRVVSAVMQSAGVDATPRRWLVLYSLTLGTTLVASHHLSSLSAFPVVLLGSPLLILAVALAVARDADMQPRSLAWHELVTMVLLGAAAATFYEIVYMAPVLAAAFIVVRSCAAGQTARDLLSTAAVRRWLVLCAGFLAVFVPVRIVIFGLCARQHCNPASDVAVSPDVVVLAARRVLTGAPPAGWAHTAQRVAPYGYRAGVFDLAANWLIAVLIAVIVVLCAGAARPFLRRAEPPSDEPAALARMAAALAVLGAVAAVMPALMAALSKELQGSSPAVGEAWRDSLVVQIGWSFVIFAAVVAALALACRRRGATMAVAVLAVGLLCVGLAATLITNQRLGHIGRGTPTTMLVRQLSTAVVRVDLTEAGNARRCGVIGAYNDLYPDPYRWWWGPQVREEFNHFMLDRYGVLFCDGPGEERELTSDPPGSWDWQPWE